ncbi:MAG: glycosyltransferase [Nitrospirae bacterium]|nr:glycosyltransferase [Nitrospirota bacterium]
MKSADDPAGIAVKSSTTKLLKEILYFPDRQKGWYKFALKKASEYVEREKVDVVMSTSPPVTSHLIAGKLKKKHNIPWVADLRDPWTTNQFYNKYKFIKYFDRKLELKTLHGADIIVTTTPEFVDTMQELHEMKKITCITNGYDADDFPDVPVRQADKFTITYTGTLAGGKRDPSVLFGAVKQLIVEKKVNKDMIEIRFFTRKEEQVVNKTEKYGLSGVVNYYDFIPRVEALDKQRESHLLLLLLDSNGAEQDVYPAKVFEYFGAQRPIIALGGKRSIIKDLLEETGCGTFVENRDALKRVLLGYYEEFCRCGQVKFNENSDIYKYSYKSIAQRYSEVLDECFHKD